METDTREVAGKEKDRCLPDETTVPSPGAVPRALELSFPPGEGLLSLGLCGWELAGVSRPF